MLALAACAAYWPCRHGEFIWDDAAWTRNSSVYLRDLRGLWEIWTNTTAMQQYYPVTSTTFWIDWHLWRDWTLPYHLENVLLHALSAIMFRHLLHRLQIPGATLAAFVFALHPVMVESVAWITERKNVLSLALFFGAVIVWERDTDAGTNGPSWRGWWITLLLFCAALLAKITVVVLPPALLLITWWKKGRLDWRKNLVPVLPLFVPAAALGVLITWLERYHVGAEGADFALTLSQRTVLAGRAFWFYPTQLIWPADVRLFYPKWSIDTGSPFQWLWPISAVATLAAAWLLRGRIGRGTFASLSFYAGTLLPVMGFFNVYGMLLADVADRWVYVPSLGLIALGAACAARHFHTSRWRMLPWAAIPILFVMTWRHAGHYATEETFWRTAIRDNPDCWCARNNLGTVLARKQQYEEALGHLDRALELRPAYPDARCNRANLLRETDRKDEAIADYREALRMNPDYPDALNNLGLTLLQRGQHAEAEELFRRAITVQPMHAMAHNNLGNVLLQAGRPEEAIAAYQHALDIQPDYADALNNIGLTRLRQQRPADALPFLEQAITARPDYAEAINNLGHALLMLGRRADAKIRFQQAVQVKPGYAQAYHNLAITCYLGAQVGDCIAAYNQALEANPNLLGSLNNLAWILATFPDDNLRDGIRALELANKASDLSGQNDPTILHTLAAALAENARYDDAAAAARRALEMSKAQGNASLGTAISDQLRLYESHHPFRDVAPSPAP